MVLDGSTHGTKMMRSLRNRGQLAVVIINKMDLEQQISTPEIAARLQGYPLVRTSATLNQGIDQLENVIAELLDQELDPAAGENPIILNMRHAEIIREAGNLIDAALQASASQPLEIVSLVIKEALKLGEIVGAVSEELLTAYLVNFALENSGGGLRWQRSTGVNCWIQCTGLNWRSAISKEQLYTTLLILEGLGKQRLVGEKADSP